MKLKYTWIPFIFAFLFFVPLRLYVVVTGTYPSIGSFSYSYLEAVSSILTALFVLMIIIMCVMAKNAPSNINFEKNIIAGVLSFVSGIIIICSGISSFISAFNNFDSKVLALSILSMMSGAVFLLMGYTHYTSNNIFKRAPLLILIPVLWCGLRIFMLFIDYTSVVSTQIDASYMLALMSLFVFLYMQSRAFVHVDYKSIVKKMIIFGMPCIVLMSSYTLTDIVSILASDKFTFDYTFMLVIADVVLACYIFSVLTEITMRDDNDNVYFKSIYSKRENTENNSYEQNSSEDSKSRAVPDSMTRKSKVNNDDGIKKMSSDDIDDLIKNL